MSEFQLGRNFHERILGTYVETGAGDSNDEDINRQFDSADWLIKTKPPEAVSNMNVQNTLIPQVARNIQMREAQAREDAEIAALNAAGYTIPDLEAWRAERGGAAAGAEPSRRRL